MNQISIRIKELTGIPVELQHNILVTVLIMISLTILRIVILQFINRRITDQKIFYKSRKTLSFILFLFGLLLISQVWIQEFKSLITFLGLLSAGIAIALKDPLVNFAGWGFIIWRKPFVVGDRIQIGDIKGDVIDVRIFQFTLLEIGHWIDADQSTGRTIHIPNGKVFTEPQINFTTGFNFIWDEINVLLTFESNWKKGKDILLSIAVRYGAHFSEMATKQYIETSKKYLLPVEKTEPIVFTSVKDSGIQLSIRYICDPRERRNSSHMIWEAILEEFKKHQDIDLAYPTIRYFDQKKEGKEM